MWALVPVKRLRGAKKRLSDVLSEAERSDLARAMLLDVLNALQGARSLTGVAVITRDEDAISIAEARGIRVILDPEQGGLNEALSEAIETLAGNSARGVLIIHGDVPAVTSEEIDRLVSVQDQVPYVTIAPALSDGGTNGMVFSPPDAISLHYGADSAAKHLGAAKENDLPAKTIELSGLGLDIYHPEDLKALLALKPPGETLDYLLASGIAERLQGSTGSE